MSRIPIPPSIDAAPAASRPLLAAVQAQFGSIPNLFRLAATSPAALGGLLGLHGALGKGALDPATRERIALAVAQVNGCGYCLAAHTWVGKAVAKLDDAEIAANRAGRSGDARADAAVAFAARIAAARGAVAESELQALRTAGYADDAIVEIVAHVALNTLTNYLNEVFKTDLDFPAVPLAHAA